MLVCHEPSVVPRVLECGHVVCEGCLKSWDNATNPLPLGVVVTAATPQHHTNRKCPLCRYLLVGPGYKCYNLRALVKNMLAKISNQTPLDKKADDDLLAVEYDQDSNERRALIDLRIKYLRQVEQGEFAAQQVLLLFVI